MSGERICDCEECERLKREREQTRIWRARAKFLLLKYLELLARTTGIYVPVRRRRARRDARSSAL